MSKVLIERQVFVTWYTPDEKLPPEGLIVVATVSGHGANVTFDHAFVLAEWYAEGLGWNLTDVTLSDFTVHAWCDLEPYGAEESMERLLGYNPYQE